MDLRQIAIWSAMPVTIDTSTTNSTVAAGVAVTLSLRILDKENEGASVDPRQFREIWNLPSLRSQILFDVLLLDATGVEVRKFAGLPAQQPPDPQGGAMNALMVWQTLLGGARGATTYLESTTAQRSVLSAPFHTLAEMLHVTMAKNLYREASTNNSEAELDASRTTRKLTVDEEHDLFAEVRTRLERTGTIDFNLTDWNQPPDCYNKDQWEWGILRFILTEERKAAAVKPVATPIAHPQPGTEFHEVLATIGQYPALARHFGLIYEVLLPADAFENVPAPITHLRVTPVWPTPAAPDPVKAYNLSPRTRVQVVGGKLQLVAANAPYVDGFLDLTKDALFKFHQIDPNLSATHSVSPLTQDQESPLALTSVGIALVWQGLGSSVSERLKATKEREKRLAEVLKLAPADPEANGSSIEFTAEDLTRGFAVDVQDVSTGQWKSLNQREGTYQFSGDLGSVRFTDEGWVSTSGTLAAGNTVVIRDAVFWWSGWSLSAQRPGKVWMPDGGVGIPDEKGEMGRFLSAEFEPVDNSLMRLRFGKKYKFRLRLVDLSGNRVSLSAANQVVAPVSKEVTYGRFEPIVSPTVTPRILLDKSFGETTTRLVVKTSDIAASNSNDTERWIFPPRVSPFLAETHGMFDAPELWGEAAWDIITKREETLPPVLPSFSGPVRYLPDPMACNSVVKGLPFGWKQDTTPATNDVFKCPWTTGQWFECKPWLLKVAKSKDPTPAVWKSNERTLTVFLPPGHQACLSISNDIACHPAEIFTLVQPQAAMKRPACDVESLCAAIAAGCGTGLTPCATVEVVHAVQRPPAKPMFVEQDGNAALAVTRQPNQTFADFTGAVAVHSPSTGSVEIEAEWDDWADHGTEDYWNVSWKRGEKLAKTSISGLKAQIPIKPGTKENLSTCGEDIVPFRHVFNDTCHRLIKYSPIVASRYETCFDTNVVSDFQVKAAAPVEISIPSSAPPPAPQIRYAVPVFNRPPVQRTTTSTTQQLIAHSMRIYLERKWYVSGADEAVGVVLKAANTPVPKPFTQHVSAWGQDPLHLTSASIGELVPDAFENRWKDLGIPEVVLREQINAAAEASLQESYKVRIVPHKVIADKANNCWYTDVLIKSPAVNAPFVRLAIVRYQRNSLPGMEVSEVKLVDYVQLLPDRVATVTTSGTFRVITVKGPDTAVPPVKFKGSERRVVEAGFEWARTTGDAIPDEFAWELEPISLGPSIAPGMFRLPYDEAAGGWTSRIQVPAGLPGGPGIQRRISIREYDLYDTDDKPGHRLMYSEALLIT